MPIEFLLHCLSFHYSLSLGEVCFFLYFDDLVLCITASFDTLQYNVHVQQVLSVLCSQIIYSLNQALRFYLNSSVLLFISHSILDRTQCCIPFHFLLVIPL